MTLPTFPIDRYDYEAGVLPALIAVLSPALSIYGLFPALFRVGYGVVPLICSCGIVVWLAQVARDMGKRKEPKLFELWGGKPSTALLRHSDDTLDPQTKARYHLFLIKNVPLLTLPAAEQEQADPASADAAYDSAIRWLLTRTRGQKLLLTQNIHYGFRRNLWALRPIGASLALLSTLAMIVAAIIALRLNEKPDARVLILAAMLAFIFAAWVAADPSWVKRAAYAYAHELLAACDGMTPAVNTAVPKKREKSSPVKS